MSTSVAAEQITNVEENVNLKAEPKTRVSFPVKLDDGKELNSLGLRKKKLFPLTFKIYTFGMYADNTKLKELIASKFEKPLPEPTEELYELVINSDTGITVRLVIVFEGLTMSMIRKNFDEGLGASLYPTSASMLTGLNLTYIDEDGDELALDNDHGLNNAVLNQKLDSLRINVRLKFDFMR